jgi:hypothetical protein
MERWQCRFVRFVDGFTRTHQSSRHRVLQFSILLCRQHIGGRKRHTEMIDYDFDLSRLVNQAALDASFTGAAVLVSALELVYRLYKLAVVGDDYFVLDKDYITSYADSFELMRDVSAHPHRAFAVRLFVALCGPRFVRVFNERMQLLEDLASQRASPALRYVDSDLHALVHSALRRDKERSVVRAELRKLTKQ